MNRLDDAKSAEVFKRIASVPRYSKLASIGYSGDKLHLQLVSTVRDFDQKKKLNFETTVVLDTATYHQEDQQISVSVPSSCDATSGQRALSPSGTREAVCKTVGDKRFIQVILFYIGFWWLFIQIIRRDNLSRRFLYR